MPAPKRLAVGAVSDNPLLQTFAQSVTDWANSPNELIEMRALDSGIQVFIGVSTNPIGVVFFISEDGGNTFTEVGRIN
jgi:hypothetical protein